MLTLFAQCLVTSRLAGALLVTGQNAILAKACLVQVMLVVAPAGVQDGAWLAVGTTWAWAAIVEQARALAGLAALMSLGWLTKAH